jgi:hypothetical protein
VLELGHPAEHLAGRPLGLRGRSRGSRGLHVLLEEGVLLPQLVEAQVLDLVAAFGVLL